MRSLPGPGRPTQGRAALMCGLAALLAVALLVSFGHAAVAADADEAMLQHLSDAYRNAAFARALGWVALALGVLNLIALTFLVRGLAVHGWSLLGQGELPFILIRRRQKAMQRGIGELNAYLSDLEADRPRLNDVVTTAGERLRSEGGAKG